MKEPRLSSFRKSAIAIILLLNPVRSLASVPGDEHWDNQFGTVGPIDTGYTVAVANQSVYVGGFFLAAGNTRANAIARYDGTNWFQLNNGVSGSSGSTYVFALAQAGSNLYVGGWFTNADNCGARNLARWDGNSWSPLAGGDPNSIVECIKIVGTNLFVGGVFTTNGSVPASNIARWDGSNWSAFGSGVTGGSPSVVDAIEYDGTNLYVGGTFTQAGSVNATNVARWNGTAWLAMGNGLPGNVTSLALHGGYLYAGGAFTNAGLTITNLAKWDGNSWTPAGLGADRTVRELLSNGTNLYVGGDFSRINGVLANRVARWDGSGWSSLGAGIQGFGAGANSGVYKMVFDSVGRLIVSGNFNQAGGVGVSHVAGWDGTNWFALGATTSKGMSHFLGQVQGLFSDGTNLFAGGTFTEGGSVIANGVASWNGTNWCAVGSVVNGQLPSNVARTFARGGGYLFAGGSFTNIGGVAAGRIAQWDGTNWYNANGDADGVVRALAYDGSFLWAGGVFTNIGGIYSPGVAVLGINSGWFSLGSVAGGGQNVSAILWDGANIYIGGNFTSVNGVSATNIARFNSSTWSPLGNGVNGSVNALAVTNGMVYAGGSFTSASGVSANRIARWDGSTWSGLGSGLTGFSSSASVSGIALKGNDVYVVGSFTNAGGTYAPGIAKWNGTTWSPLGSGFYSTLTGPSSGLAITVHGGSIYVGGSFMFAGDKPSSFVGRWNDQLNFYPPPHLTLARPAWLPGGQYRFRVNGTSGESYVLQTSANLLNWTSVLTNTTPMYDFTDSSASSFSNRFYRAVLGP